MLVIPHADGLSLFDHTGAEVSAWTWPELAPTCAPCLGEAARADGEGLLFAFVHPPDGWPPAAAPGFDGGFLRLTATGADPVVDAGFAFPHAALRDPADGTIAVLESGRDRITWVAGDGSSVEPLRTLELDQPSPNGVDLIVDGASTYLLIGARGDGPFGGTSYGHLELWDITDPSAMSQVWVFPSTGALDTVHGPVLRRVDGAWWLLYAHSYGAGDGGSVGVARTADLRSPPTYLADLVPPEGLDFVRGVDLADDGLVIATDSGEELAFDTDGRVLTGALPKLAETGATGAIGDQVHVDWPAGALADGLSTPFEAWIWRPMFAR